MTDEATALAARIKRINAATEAVRGQARSVDGTVHIETDARGSITDLRLSSYAAENGLDRLAALIVDQHRLAHTRAEAEAERVFTELSQDQPAAPRRLRDSAALLAAEHESAIDQSWSSGHPNRRISPDHRFGGHEYVL